MGGCYRPVNPLETLMDFVYNSTIDFLIVFFLTIFKLFRNKIWEDCACNTIFY